MIEKIELLHSFEKDGNLEQEFDFIEYVKSKELIKFPELDADRFIFLFSR